LGQEREAQEANLDPLSILQKGLGDTEQPAALKPDPKAEKPKTEGGALRGQLEKTLSEKRDLEKRLAELEKREDPRIKELTTAWESEKRAKDELDAKIAHLDYSQSVEFRSRFVEPYESAVKDTLGRLRNMVTEDGTKLTQDDLEAIIIGGEEGAYQLIDQKFTGPKATLATGIVKDVYSLERVRDRALEQAKSMAVEKRKLGEAQNRAQQEQVKILWAKERDGRKAAAKDLFERRDNDKERNQALDEGEVLAEAAFWHPPNVSPEQLIAIKAEVRNRAAALPAMRLSYMKEKARADALEAELVKYRGHSPGNGEPGDGQETERNSKHQPGTMGWAVDQLRELSS